MDEEGSNGSEDETVELKKESKSMEEAIKEGIRKASERSIQSHEDTVFQFSPVYVRSSLQKINFNSPIFHRS